MNAASAASSAAPVNAPKPLAPAHASALVRPVVNAPRSVSYFTFGRRKICQPYLAKMGDENASHRMDRPRRTGRAWPALVGCRDVQIGPHAQRGNQFGLACSEAVGVSLTHSEASPARKTPAGRRRDGKRHPTGIRGEPAEGAGVAKQKPRVRAGLSVRHRGPAGRGGQSVAQRAREVAKQKPRRGDGAKSVMWAAKKQGNSGPHRDNTTAVAQRTGELAEKAPPASGAEVIGP